jgi:hypothetical protein
MIVKMSSNTVKVISDLTVIPTKRQMNKEHKGASYDIKFNFEGQVKKSDLIVIQYSIPYKDERHIDREMIKHISLYVMGVKDNRLRAVNINITENPTDKIKIGDTLHVYGNAYEKH